MSVNLFLPYPVAACNHCSCPQLKKFANAKAISSRDFQDASNAEAEAERRDRLNKFSGASAISSADYFGRADSRGGVGGSGSMGPAGSGDLDISAADIVNRLSFQVGTRRTVFASCAQPTENVLALLLRPWACSVPVACAGYSVEAEQDAGTPTHAFLVQAKQDMQQMKQMAAAATKKISGMATKLLGDLNRMNGEPSR